MKVRIDCPDCHGTSCSKCEDGVREFDVITPELRSAVAEAVTYIEAEPAWGYAFSDGSLALLREAAEPTP